LTGKYVLATRVSKYDLQEFYWLFDAIPKVQEFCWE